MISLGELIDRLKELNEDDTPISSILISVSEPNRLNIKRISRLAKKESVIDITINLPLIIRGLENLNKSRLEIESFKCFGVNKDLSIKLTYNQSF